MKIFLTFLTLMTLALPALPALSAPVPESFADLVEQHQGMVVNISTTQVIQNQNRFQDRPDIPPGFRDFFEDFMNRNPEGQDGDGPLPPQRATSLGSGFLISADGYIVTNNHVINEAEEITVTLMSGEEYKAEVVGRDGFTDVALLKIEAGKSLQFAAFGDSDKIRVGEWVITIGNPFGLGGTVTAGIISARNRDINNGPYDDFIQTDASINRGNSGGPMFNMKGEVIGVNTMIFSPTGTNIGIGFAIPSNQVKSVVAQLKEFGRTKRGWIGVTIQQVTQETAGSLGLAKAEGAIVSEVVADGPSAKAGLKPGDIITVFNGEPIEDWRELPRVVAETGIGKTVKLTVIRDGKSRELTITTGDLETNLAPQQVAGAPAPETPREPDRILGMVLKPLNDLVRERFDIPPEVQGVFVETLSRSSEAALRQVRPGDVIVQVNLKPVRTPQEVEAAVVEAKDKGRETVLFRIYRGGSYFHVPVPVNGGAN
ncbi:MAG TPA: DegQ family serine endoprotease [Sphingomonadales bacterium]|nr:DegQ family serine endoprotease [Sphingomonadales bacterium]